MEGALVVFALEQESQDLFKDQDVLYTGVGKINAAYALTRRLYQNRPSIVINMGTAGSTKYPAGTVLHSTCFIQRDMDVSPLGFARWETPFSGQSVILEYGQSVSNTPHAICGTGDDFEINHDGHHYDIVDMEAYSLARVCQLENVPFVCLKYISDGADSKAHSDWGDALRHAAVSLKSALDCLASDD